MLFNALTTKKSPAALIPFLLLIAAVLVGVLREGITVYYPEDASRYYREFATWVGGLSLPLQVLITLLVFLVVGVSLYRLVVNTGVLGHASKTIPLFLVFFSLVAVSGNFGIHPPIIAMIFLIPAIHQVILAGNTTRPHQTIFNAGFLASSASLIAFPMIVFLPSFFAALWVFRLYKWNFQAVMAAGMILPWAYALVPGWVFLWYPYEGVFSVFGMMISGVLYFPEYVAQVFSLWDYLLIGITSIFIAISFLSVYSRLSQKLIQVRYMYRALMWLGLPALLLLVFSGAMVLRYIIVFGFFLSIVGSSYFATAKRSVGLDLLLWLMLSVVIISYFY